LDTHGLARHVAISDAPLLPEPLLREWDKALAADPARATGEDEGDANTLHLEVRQAIADARGDLDSYIALETRLPAWRQNPLRVAERLLAGRRQDEALEWVRRDRRSGVGFATSADIADGRINRLADLAQVRLEARILEAMGDREKAQRIRWAAFEASLDADLLRDYIAKLDDFHEQDELDRAFTFVAKSEMIYVALHFFIVWPRFDLAAKLVVDRIKVWDGRHYDILGHAAQELEHDYPLAATVLYRALLNDILGRAKSQAYRYGAAYLERLADLSDAVSVDPRLENHVTYLIGLRKAHGRKRGFWQLIDGGGTKHAR
jgi:hypothetical protein